MLPKRVQVIKREQIALAGSVCVTDSGTASAKTGDRLRTPGACGTPQQARVVESNSEYAIIEVTCSCGGKSHIQCNYAHLNEGN